MSLRLGFMISHPIQYYAPLFRALAEKCDLNVFFAHRQTAEGQARSGFNVAFEWDVDLLSGYKSQFLENVARQPSTDRFDGCNTPEIGKLIAQGGFDGFVVPGWGLRSYMQAVRACRRAGVPVMGRGDSQLPGPRSSAIQLIKALAFPHLLRRFDGFLYVGQRSRAYLAHYGVPPSRLFFAPACVDNDAFASAAKAAPAKRPGPTRRLLFVGKLMERKRPIELVQAAALLGKRGIDVEVAFAGSGEQQAALEQMARDTGVKAVFLGFVNQSALPAAYASADLLVLPSDARETWGLVVNEAMACGLPAVVSDAVGCGPDLVEEGATGAIFPLGDVEGQAAALERTLTLDPAASRAAVEARIARYSPSRAAQGIMNAIATLRQGK